MVDLMPVGWRGFMLAGFFAAYMSTIATHLNWGASYLVNDVYKRFVAPTASDRKLVLISRVTTLVLFALSLLVTSQMQTIEQAWRVLLALGSGTGLVLILRWLWWRVSAASEISAMVASVVLSLGVAAIVSSQWPALDDTSAQAVVMLATVAGSTLVWLAVTFASKPESDDVLRAFITRVRPFGAGWASVYARLGIDAPKAPIGLIVAGFFAGVALVYTSVFAIGQLILGPRMLGAALAIVALVLAFVLVKVVARVTAPAPEATLNAPPA
jgi:uncharacterized sodium:solute symporter family permease YidK